MIRERRRTFGWIAMFWFLPLLGLLTCYVFNAAWWLWTISAIAFVSGVIQQAADLNQYCDWKKRLTKIDGGLTNRNK